MVTLPITSRDLKRSRAWSQSEIFLVYCMKSNVEEKNKKDKRPKKLQKLNKSVVSKETLE